MVLTKPMVRRREARPYAAIRASLKMSEIPSLLPPLLPEVLAWLQVHGLAPAGPCFFRYRSLDPSGRLTVEVGWPVQGSAEGDGRVHFDQLPAGAYVCIEHHGAYHSLAQAHQVLESWMAREGWQDSCQDCSGLTSWRGRAEFYITDPCAEKDPDQWLTQLEFLIAQE